MAYEEQTSLAAWHEDLDNVNALGFLQAVYRSAKLPLSVRMRAASIALPFESPKLQMVGYSQMTDASFAQALDRAIARSAAGKVVLELSANSPATNGAGEGDERR